MKKKLMIVLIMMFGLVLFCRVDCFADGAWEGTGDIGGSSGGGSGGSGSGSGECYKNDKLTEDGTYLLSCQGFSWAYYKATDAAKGKDVEFRPWGQVTIPKECSEHNGEPGGFWHFGRNAIGLQQEDYFGNKIGYFGGYNFVHISYSNEPWYYTYHKDHKYSNGSPMPSYEWGNDSNSERDRLYTYSTEPGSRGHYETYSYGSYKNNYANTEKCYGGCYKKDNLANHRLYYGNEVVYEIDKDKSENDINEVLKDYKAAHKYFDPTGPEPTDFPDKLYAFCYWEGMDIKYYGASWVTMNPKPEGSDRNWMNTGITGTYKDIAFGPTTVDVGDEVEIKFDHDVFASALSNNVGWSVAREWDNKVDGYSFIEQSNQDPSGEVNLGSEYNNSNNIYYTNNGNVLEDPYKIKFMKAGEYTYCESLTIDKLQTKPITRMCAKVNVRPPIEYYAVSNVSAGRPHVTSTGVVKTPKFVSDREDYGGEYVKVKDEVQVTFSHIVYSSREAKNVQWQIERKFNNDTNGGRWKLVPRGNTESPLNNGDSGFSSVVTNVSNLTEKSDTSVGGVQLWYSPQENENGYIGRPYADGGDTRYSWRDIYWATFNKIGDYSGDDSNLCEILSIPGGDNNMTGGCTDIKVPYNFKNSASIKLGEGIVQVGGTVKIESATVTVGKKTNRKVWCSNWVDTGDGTGYCPDEYATQVDNATIKLIKYSALSMGGSANEGYSGSDLCNQNAIGGSSTWCETEDRTGVYLNQDNNTDGVTSVVDGINSTERAITTDAGGYYCVRLAIYPYTNGADDNVNNPEGSNSWYISAPSCVQVGKKPTFQVWGGSVYSAGVINANSFIRSTNDGKKTFGSWVEQSAVANGGISEFASGAAISQGAPTSKDASTDFCKYQVPLTFANHPCGSASAGNANIAANVAGKSAAINYWWVANPVINGSDFKYDVNANSDGMYYKYSAGDTEIGGMTIGRGKTYVLRSRDGNIYIRDNILYENGPYKLASDIPKLIMYAKNIYIDCNVKRVDAILVADNKIDTCAGADGKNPGENDRQRSNQLTINGVLMAKVVQFNRTYGGGAGEEAAKTPAEIVNYDTSTMLWGRGGTESSADSLFTVVYQQELAPRY